MPQQPVSIPNFAENALRQMLMKHLLKKLEAMNDEAARAYLSARHTEARHTATRGHGEGITPFPTPANFIESHINQAAIDIDSFFTAIAAKRGLALVFGQPERPH